jgi:hypothetical protein
MVLALFVSTSAFSHVRWFVEENGQNLHFTWSPIYYFLIGAAMCYGVFSYFTERRLQAVYQGSFFTAWRRISQWDLLAYGCGITFVFISFENIFLAPNIEITNGLEDFLIIQAISGIVLLTALPGWVKGCAVLLLCGMAVDAVSMNVWIDYIFEFVAVGLALCLMKWAPNLSLTILRAGLGLQLMTLAIHNKLMDPALGLAFLSDYQWNFMKLLGLSEFDDLLFVFSAGIAELTFGLLIFFAVGTRFVIFSVSFFFMLTSILLGMHELIGHVPIVVCCLVLFSLGGGYNAVHCVSKLSEHVITPIQLYFAHKRA